MRKSYFGLGALPVVFGVALGLTPPATSYTSLDEQGDPLRATFNQDVGKVRVLMLVAPT